MFEKRRSQFLAALGDGGVAIVQGARPVRRSNDTEYPFRQDSDFHYLTGFDYPNAVAVFRSGGPGYTLFVEPRDAEAETWNGYRPGVEGALREHGADRAHPVAELPQRLPAMLAGCRRLYHALGRDAALDAQIVGLAETLRLRSRDGENPPEAIADPRDILHEMRLRKEPGELELLRRAAAITAEAHREAAALAWPGRFEYEMEAQLLCGFRSRGAAGAAYGSIVGGGPRATTLHYVQNDQPLAGGEVVLVDAGCELEGYASDVTRCYPVGGRFAPAQRAIYDLVLESQRAALEAVRPGATLPAVHQAALAVLARGMIELGLLQGTPEQVIEQKRYTRYFMHGTSHWIGLDVHDVGAYAQQGAPRRLEAGMVFSVEPGLYVPQDDAEAPAELRGIGIRIEDDVVVTSAGCENLNAAIPKEAPAVEAWVQAGEATAPAQRAN